MNEFDSTFTQNIFSGSIFIKNVFRKITYQLLLLFFKTV